LDSARIDRTARWTRDRQEIVVDALVGFEVGFWDYMTFATLFVIIVAFLTAAVLILGPPGRIAVEGRK
jgi:hypothetical protein